MRARVTLTPIFAPDSAPRTPARAATRRDRPWRNRPWHHRPWHHRPWITAALLATLLLSLGAPLGRAYEPASTHAGMTQRAAQHGHQLHSWLRRAHGLPLGAYEPLQLDLQRMPLLLREKLQRHLQDLDPVHGYRPNAQGYNRASAWLAAGTVLEGMPFSRNRNHFYNPRTGHGLRNATGHSQLSLRLRALDFTDGHGNFGGIITGANFNLTGHSVLEWARYRHNRYRLQAHLERRLRSLIARTPAERQHHLAMALITLGALLHLVQEMAVPAQVRNDFVASYLAQRSNILVDRASAYEVWVRRTYGRTGIPRVTGKLPSFDRFDHFFTNSKSTGLADRTHRRFFSLGSLPKARRLRGDDTPKEILAAVNESLPFAQPRVKALTLREAIGTGLYYGTDADPYLFAYRVTRDGRLEFTLDERCYAAAARRLVPEAVRYTAGLLAFLLRGTLEVTARKEVLEIRHKGPALAKGTLHVLWESASGQRLPIEKVTLPGTVKSGAPLAEIPARAVPKEARRIIVAFTGQDTHGEPLVLGAVTSR